jgi:hypothetical protein
MIQVFRWMLVLLVAGTMTTEAQRGNKRILDDKTNAEQTLQWVYDDLDQGIEKAKAENKPLMVVIR